MRLPRATPLLGEKENISLAVTPAKPALRCRVHLDAWIAHTGCQAIWINFYIQFCFDVIFRSEMIQNKIYRCSAIKSLDWLSWGVAPAVCSLQLHTWLCWKKPIHETQKLPPRGNFALVRRSENLVYAAWEVRHPRPSTNQKANRRAKKKANRGSFRTDSIDQF
jgi:hypothetical protein